MNYSPELKESLPWRMLPPNNESITKLAREEGISEQTLRNWRDKARTDGMPAPGTDAQPDEWSTQDKFLVVVETASMNETELAEYARKKGLYVEQIPVMERCLYECKRRRGQRGRTAEPRAQRVRKRTEKAGKRASAEGESACGSCCALSPVKKSRSDLGGPRGRMISASDRENAIQLIEEAVQSGAELRKACERLGITERTYYNWKRLQKNCGLVEDRRPCAVHPEPANKLNAEERQAILDTVNSEKYASMPPCEIVPALADEGKYIASESTFYRVLREEDMQHHRGRSEASGKHAKPTSYAATAPNQVYMWDITYLHGPIKGLFFYLYLIIDLFSRDIVGWEVWPEENAEHASELIRRACLAQKRLTTQPLVLHSDNGSPMKGATMLETLYALG